MFRTYREPASPGVSSSPKTPRGLLHQAADELFGDGHPRFNDLMIEIMDLHSEKNRGYAGDGHALGNFERVAAIMRLYPNFPITSPAGVAIMYCMKHIDRILWDMCRTHAPSDESLADIAVYMTIMRCMNLDRSAEFAK